MPTNQSRKLRKRRRRPRRGPIMRFRFSRFILIWVFCFVVAFLLYMLSRNLHPEKDVFRKKQQKEESSASSAVIPAESSAEKTPSAEESSAAPVAESSVQEESSEPVNVPAKVNPVPASPLQTDEYLKKCAFVGETDIYHFGQEGLLGVMNTYASEALNLTNYGKEYVDLNGTTIHIQSALYSAKCPIYLMFGTEDLLAGQPADQTADQFSVLLNMMKASAPSVNIFVLSIPPVTATVSNKLDNAVIDEYNSLLLQIANENDVYFVDTNTALKNNAGQIDWVYVLEDGIHLNAVGGQVLLDYVLSHVPE